MVSRAQKTQRWPAPEPVVLPSITVSSAGPAGPALEQRLAGRHPSRGRLDASKTAPLERAAINNAELRANAQTVVEYIRSTWPKNTELAYGPKQEEFQQFCQLKQYRDGDTVTEDKLLLFLVDEVTSRPLRARSRKAAAEVPLSETRLSWRSVRSYVTAITDLYRVQKALGMNSHPSPREDNAREYVKSLQRRDAGRDKANYADKGRDTLLDGYTEAELRKIAGTLWDHMADSAECHLRTLVDLLLGHYMLTRGGDRRSIEISDLFTFEFTGEGPTRCMPLILTTRGGKQNQHGRLETAGALRNRDPMICILGAIAFYLLARWDLSIEPFPDFESRPKWYDIRLIKGIGSDPKKPLSYNSQQDWVVKAFGYAGVSSNKKTHVGRSSGAKTAELKGVSEAQIRRAGRWNQEQMIGCYLNSLPRKFMRTMAGHLASMGSFEIRRARVTPPESLQSMIWPDLDKWRDRFGPSPGQGDDLAAAGLVYLLLYFREVILQDSAVLMDRFPKSPIWNHPVFQHPDYRLFAQEVSAYIEEDEQPSQLTLLTQAVPALTDYLQSSEARGEARIAELTATLTAEIREIESRLADTNQSSLRKVLAEGVFQLKLVEPAPDQGLGLGLEPAPAITFLPPPPGSDGSALPSPSRLSSPSVGELPPRHCMSRAVKTVEGLWREWTVGRPGQPSIAALDGRWGSRWRAGRRAELQWYSLRLEVIREIHRLARTRRIAVDAAVYALSTDQRQSNASLDLFCKRLRANRKARDGSGGGAAR